MEETARRLADELVDIERALRGGMRGSNRLRVAITNEEMDQLVAERRLARYYRCKEYELRPSTIFGIPLVVEPGQTDQRDRIKWGGGRL